MAEDDKRNTMLKILQQRGDEIRRAREAQGLSQAELAEKASTSQQTIDRLERGAVEHSRAYPAVRRALSLDLTGYDTWPYDVEENNDFGGRLGKHEEREGKAFEQLGQGRIPVISNRGGKARLVDAIPRVYPFEFAEGVTAVLITSPEMEPVFRLGDTVVVNPNLVARPGDDVGYAKEEMLYIRTLVEEQDDLWVVQTWNPEKRFEIRKNPKLIKLDVVVARYCRNR